MIKRLLVVVSNKELAEELYKPIIRKFEKRKVHSPFIDNLADIPLIGRFNKNICFYYVINIFSIYACVIPLKDKKAQQLLMLFR